MRALGLIALKIAVHWRTLSARSAPGVSLRCWHAWHQLATRISSCDMKNVLGRNSSLTRLAWSRRICSSLGSLRQHITCEPWVTIG